MNTRPATFIPVGETDNPRWTGKRKRIQRCAATQMFWGETAKQHEDAFRLWHHMAMQVAHSAKVSFRLLALVERHVDMKTGTLSGTNAELAVMGGRCSVATIKREVGHYENLGLFIGTRRRHRKTSGDIIEVRTLRLSLPKVFAPGISMPGDWT